MNLIDRLDPKRLEKFFYYMSERQAIFWKRTTGKPRPWTNDPVLRDHFFCNNYRELDRGTQFCWNNILMNTTSDQQMLFRVLLYRLFNEPMTYMAMKHCINKGPAVVFDGVKAAAILDRRHEDGIRIFRGAWMTSGADISGMSKARAYCMEMRSVSKRIPELTKQIEDTLQMKDAWKIICGIKWFGPFSAYQVILDLNYVPAFNSCWEDRDTWTVIGPGCKKGILWLMGFDPVRSKGQSKFGKLQDADMLQVIRYLSRHQDKLFSRYGLMFKRWNFKKLDIHNIEFSLCEFQKYMRAHQGGKKKTFVPSDEQLKLKVSA